jgi:hypothetical protein
MNPVVVARIEVDPKLPTLFIYGLFALISLSCCV